jgi:hypothetical protein
MTSMNASEAREKLCRLPVGQEDWNSIQETPSLKGWFAIPIDQCEKEPAGDNPDSSSSKNKLRRISVTCAKLRVQRSGYERIFKDSETKRVVGRRLNNLAADPEQ